MKKFILLPLIMVAMLMSCSVDSILGSGDLTSEMRNVESFTKLSSEGVFEVNITQGTTQSVQIIADDNIVHKIKTKVVNGELRLYLDNHNYKHINLKANITVTRLNGLKNSGSGNIYAYNIDEAESFKIKNSGSADIIIEGQAASLSVDIEGSGSIMGFNFSVNDCSVDIDGSGNVEINCSNKLNVEIDGSGSVYYIGNPTVHTSINGSGKVINE